MIKNNKKNDVSYPLVYSLVTLALILLVGTVTVEKAFSVMNIIKNRLRNWIGDQWMNDYLVIYINKYKFKTKSCSSFKFEPITTDHPWFVVKILLT